MQRILVIDDSELVTRLLREALLEAGYEVVVAHDADSGHRAAIAVTPDLILLDVKLPDVTGYELLRILRERSELEHVPIIMITGSHGTTEHKIRGFQGGADDYILKPFEISELLERVKALLRRAQARPRPIAPADRVPAASSEIEASETSTAPSLMATIGDLLLAPTSSFSQTVLPSFGLLFLMAAEGLTFGAMALAAGPMPKPVVAGTLIVGIWGLIVSIVVVASSIAGISLRWREAASLVSLAGIPLLLRMVCALVFSVWTTLSPFIFDASPSLLLPASPMLRVLDLFMLWSAYLLWRLLSVRPGVRSRTAAFVSLLMWCLGVMISISLQRLGL